MKKKRLGFSAKFLTGIAVVYAVLIIALSFSFNHILQTNTDILKNVLLDNNESMLLKKADIVIKKLKNEEIMNLNSLKEALLILCKEDEDFLWVLIFSGTPDDDYFRVRRKIPVNPMMKIELPGNRIVQERKEVNYLRKGLFEKIIDPKIYSSNGVYWQSVYCPYQINEHPFVITFLISSIKISTVLNEYSGEINRTKREILLITTIVTAIVIIITLLFIYNFNRIIKNLSKYMKKAAEGKFDISLKETKDTDLNNLALSFNTMITELKGLKESSKLIRDMEKKDSLNDLFKYGVNLLKENRFDDSIHIFKTLTMLKPDGFGSYFNLGVAYAKQRDYDTSIAMFNKALETNPGHGHTLSYIEKVKRLKAINESHPR